MKKLKLFFAAVPTPAKIKLFFAGLFSNLLFLSGLALVCWGISMYSHAAGVIVSGVVLVILARVFTPETKKT
jgi:hypothetical protein